MQASCHTQDRPHPALKPKRRVFSVTRWGFDLCDVAGQLKLSPPIVIATLYNLIATRARPHICFPDLGYSASESYGVSYKARGLCKTLVNLDIFDDDQPFNYGVYGDIDNSHLHHNVSGSTDCLGIGRQNTTT